MGQEQNQTEWDILKQAPGDLLTRYQSIVEVVVLGFMRKGFFAKEDKAEIVQEVNLRMLESKLERIKQNYDGSVLLRTYFSRVAYNCCQDLLRQRQRQPQFTSESVLAQQKEDSLNADQKMLLRDECWRLEALLKILPKRQRSLLCLKGWARILLKQSDWQWYEGPASKEAIADLKKLAHPYDNLKDAIVFGYLAALFSIVEKTEIVPDSLRRWTNMRADRLVNDLNGDPPKAAYTNDTLKVLLRYYFERS